MAKKDMKSALSTSLSSEERAVEDRFSRAESVLAARSVDIEGVADSTSTVPAQAVEPERSKVVRDSFTMPEVDHELIGSLQKRLLGQQVAATKSEVLRAALRLLASKTDEAVAEAVGALEKVRTGRPSPRS